MPDYQFIGKAKLARGFSFPIKRSSLDLFLNEQQIDLVTGVAFCGPADDQRVLSATYYGPRRQSHSSTLTLWFNAVPSSCRKYVSELLAKETFPTLADWIGELADDSLTSNQMDHRLDVCYHQTDDSTGCKLSLTVDAPIERPQLSRFRANVRPH